MPISFIDGKCHNKQLQAGKSHKNCLINHTQSISTISHHWLLMPLGWTHTHTHTHTYVNIHTHIRKHTHTHTHTHTQRHTHTYTPTHEQKQFQEQSGY